ncbi:MAG: 5'-methylthioadenosine/adenosylhomocysteine nucleosidase [Ruminococcaceae bacterium]|nr:5'-methylthioadenosine/adenosylhomocysteine nucleosidase [Oscillospiraceae bacterium]
MKIGIIGAMSVEVDALKAKLAECETVRVSGVDFFCGNLAGKDVVVAQCGIGKVFAAICAQTMILRFGVTHIINTGVAGTLSEKLSILDVAIADGVVQHDMDTSPIGDPVGLISGINKIVLPTSDYMAKIAADVAGELGVKYGRGIIASGDQFISSADRKRYIVDKFGAVACEMEGAAIGHVCYVNGIECLIVRAISDSASGEATMEYPQMVALAAEQSIKMTERIIQSL